MDCGIQGVCNDCFEQFISINGYNSALVPVRVFHYEGTPPHQSKMTILHPTPPKVSPPTKFLFTSHKSLSHLLLLPEMGH